MKTTNKQPLFIVTGASCVGKSTVCEILFQKEKKYLVLESDIIWNDIYNSPETDYLAYRKLQLTLCANISQIGLPVVLCGCATPWQFDACEEKDFFSGIYYTALICDNETLKKRMTQGRGVIDENWIKSSIEFNDWLRKNAEAYPMQLIDNSGISPEYCSEIIDAWILEVMR